MWEPTKPDDLLSRWPARRKKTINQSNTENEQAVTYPIHQQHFLIMNSFFTIICHPVSSRRSAGLMQFLRHPYLSGVWYDVSLRTNTPKNMWLEEHVKETGLHVQFVFVFLISRFNNQHWGHCWGGGGGRVVAGLYNYLERCNLIFNLIMSCQALNSKG